MSTERYDVPKEIGTLVTGQDPKQMILNRFGDRERFWEQKFQSLQCLYNEQKESNARKDESISQLSQQLNRISTSSQRNNPETCQASPTTPTQAPLPSPSPTPPWPNQQSTTTTIQTIRNLKPPPPTFSGLLSEDIDLWLKCIFNYLDGEDLPDNRMVQIASMYLRGSALQWWADQIADKQLSTGKFTMAAFMALCRARWINVHAAENARSRLDQLRQTKSIQEYNGEFEKLIGRLGSDFATEQPKIHAYLRGVKQQFRVFAAGQTYQSLQEAMASLANFESALNTQTTRVLQPLTRIPQQRQLFTSNRFSKSRGGRTPVAKRLFAKQATSEPEQGLNSAWSEAVEVYGAEKAQEMYNKQLCFKCGKRGHRACACRSQALTPENSCCGTEHEGEEETQSEN